MIPIIIYTMKENTTIWRRMKWRDLLYKGVSREDPSDKLTFGKKPKRKIFGVCQADRTGNAKWLRLDCVFSSLSNGTETSMAMSRWGKGEE
jgi:hypothetical protein